MAISSSLPLDVLTVVGHCLAEDPGRAETGVKALVACSSVSRLFREAVLGPLLWKPIYQARYTVSHHPAETARISQFHDDYRLRYYARRQIDNRALELLEELVNNPVRAREAVRTLAQFQFDIWDVLHLQIIHPLPNLLQFSSSTPDLPPALGQVLPMYYWAKSISRVLSAVQALQLWQRLRDDPTSVSFEDAFNALSAFFGVPSHELTHRFDTLSDECRAALEADGLTFDPSSPGYDTQVICQGIHAWMYSKGFKGARGLSCSQTDSLNHLQLFVTGTDFHNLLNSFPHSYLDPQAHPDGALQLSLTHIFVSIARRLGVDASPTNFPRNVIAHIRCQRDDLDDFYLDMFDPLGKILTARESLIPTLRNLAIRPSDLLQHIAPVHPNIVLARASRNIFGAFPVNYLRGGAQHFPALLAATCVSILFVPDPELIENLGICLNDIAEQTCILSDTLVPMLSNPQTPQESVMQTSLNSLDNHLVQSYADSLVNVSRRSTVVGTTIQYFVGAVFRHRRSHFLACITGWHPSCKASEQWMDQMGVDQLDRGRHQPFYHVVCDDGTKRYIAEENIEIVPVAFHHIASLFDVDSAMFRSFQGIQHLSQSDTPAYARLIPSPEIQLFFPEDLQYGNDWIAGHSQK